MPGRRRSAAATRAPSREAEVAGAEQPDHADHDQVDGDDVVEEPRHDQDQDAGDEGNDGSEAEGEVHRPTIARFAGRVCSPANTAVCATEQTDSPAWISIVGPI